MNDIGLVYAENIVTQRPQIPITVGVMPLACLGFVAIAIHLDDKPCGQADKIHDIWSDRRLTPEFQVSCFPEFPQFIPGK
jgi:hypothetical protein